MKVVRPCLQTMQPLSDTGMYQRKDAETVVMSVTQILTGYWTVSA